MILINNKLVCTSTNGQIIVEKTPYRKVGDYKYEHWFDKSIEISRADLERIYVFEVLLEDKKKRQQRLFDERLYDMLDELDIEREGK